ncbi:MAG TPA: cytochrome c biogenesis protein ResB [Euzebya sp.]|nr:cytochrome c biogenesis protein ResB [Euzebya sp.]
MTDTIPSQTAAPDDPSPPASGPRLPLIPGPLETSQMLWRRLRRMSTALMLLFALSVSTLIATFIPQEPVIASTVRLWRDGTEGPGEGIAAVFDALGLFDVFGSTWFAALTVLLFVSLPGCLVPRWRVFLRNVRTPAARGTNLDRLTHRVVLPRPQGVSDAQLLDRAERALRTYRTRRTTSPTGAAHLAAERGHWREFGSLVFHTSFYLLLIGVVLGSAFSFTGQIDIVEGGSFADTPLGYQSQIAGELWDTSNHRGQVTTIEDFEVTYLDGDNAFVPDEFVTTATFTSPDGERVVTEEIRVNHAVHFEGLTYYQRAFGFAPTIVLRSGLDGGELYRNQLILRTDDSGLWRGRDKVSLGSSNPDRPLPQIGIEVFFMPDASIDDQDNIVFNSPEPNNPRLVLTIYSGEDLGLARPVPVSQLEWPQDAIIDQAMITPGSVVPFAGGLFEVEFGEDVAMWTGLQVSHQPFRWLLLTAASLTLFGLLPSLYAYRRRLWLEVNDDHVVFAGVAQHRKPHFADTFPQLVERIQAALDPAETRSHA